MQPRLPLLFFETRRWYSACPMSILWSSKWDSMWSHYNGEIPPHLVLACFEVALGDILANGPGEKESYPEAPNETQKDGILLNIIKYIHCWKTSLDHYQTPCCQKKPTVGILHMGYKPHRSFTPPWLETTNIYLRVMYYRGAISYYCIQPYLS